MQQSFWIISCNMAISSVLIGPEHCLYCWVTQLRVLLLCDLGFTSSFSVSDFKIQHLVKFDQLTSSIQQKLLHY